MNNSQLLKNSYCIFHLIICAYCLSHSSPLSLSLPSLSLSLFLDIIYMEILDVYYTTHVRVRNMITHIFYGIMITHILRELPE